MAYVDVELLYRKCRYTLDRTNMDRWRWQPLDNHRVQLWQLFSTDWLSMRYLLRCYLLGKYDSPVRLRHRYVQSCENSMHAYCLALFECVFVLLVTKIIHAWLIEHDDA